MFVILRCMPRKANGHATKAVSIRLSAQNHRYLAELSELGIHGVTPSEIAKRFVENEIERMVREKFLALPVGEHRKDT